MITNKVTSMNSVSFTSRNKVVSFGNKKENLWESTQKRMEVAADRLELSEGLKRRIIAPERELAGNVFVDGREEPIKVWRIQHDTILGPAKGGIRMLPAVDADTVRGLAGEMSLKNSLAGLPLGGGKGGIQADPKDLNPIQRAQLFREFTRIMAPFIGPQKDIPAPDINTNAGDMDIIMDEFSKLVGHPEPAVVTGKSLLNGGSKGRADATGLGVVFTIEEACKDNGIQLNGASCAVQGSGNVGGTAARYLHARGAKVKAMSDMYGAIANPKGLNVPAVLAFIKETGSLVGFPGSEPITNAELLEMDVDVLVPAATQGQITKENADRIRAKIIAEGANGPTAPDADPILNEKGVFIVPDVLANQGGVYVSHLEHIQNLMKDSWSETAVNAKLSDQMKSRFRAVADFAKEHNVSMREAATMIAMDRIAKTYQARGIKN